MSVPGENLQIQSRAVQQPYRWQLVNYLQNRSANLLTDARLINCYAEKDLESREYQVYKRFGFSATPSLNQGSGQALGVYTDPFTSVTLWGSAGSSTGILGFHDPLAPATGTVSLSLTTTSSNSILSFCSVKSNPYTILITDGAFGYIFTTGVNTITAVTDPNFPTSIVPGPVYLDGTVYAMDINGAIHNSTALNNASNWTPSSTIQASANPDGGIALLKQLNYIVALKQYTSQIFYDAGASPGSPLAPVPDTQQPYGCLAGYTAQVIDDLAFWVTLNNTVSPQVVLLRNLSYNIVSTPAVDRLLNAFSFNKGSVISGSGAGVSIYTSVWAWVLKHSGHRFYGLTSIAQNLTLVYDIDQQLWYIWTDPNGNYWPYLGFAYQPPLLTTGLVSLPPIQYAQQYSTGNLLYPMDSCFVFPTDQGALVPVDIYTPNQDFGTVRSKTVHRMYIRADKVPAMLQIRHTDDDYQTFSNFRTVDLNLQKPNLRDEGTFQYRRAYHFRHQAATQFRISSSDMQVDVGTQ